ncbi:hypothetical protein EG329_007504 [Mollisiaceae sp. DMI_Dod_QoI]|nr:hypothetical protein EG329_007504 [Helotiales sp. DMI_Dod_QoI]
MSTIHQHTRDRSRPPAAEAESPRYEEQGDTTPKASNKRLFSNRQSRQIESNEYNGDDGGLEPTAERHSDKRHRNADWPLPSSPASPPSARRPLRNRKAPNSPSHRRAHSQQRASKFQEGSMNDRISQVPPIPYLDGEDELLEEYDPIEPQESRGRKIARPRKFTRRNGSVAASVTDQSETSRHSIFRFGKSIAASFNPSNWKIWSKGQPAQEDEETAQMRVLRERQSKAERIYRELKESGQFRNSTVVFPSSYTTHGEQKAGQGKHDSGVEFAENDSASNRGSKDMSTEEKRKGRIFLNPPKLSESVHGGSPVSHVSSSQANSNNSSPNKSFHFKKPSLSNIKKSFASSSVTNLSEPSHQARRIPSRKDLQKQQKLVKRVSNLEGKLEAARRDLSEALGEPLPSSQISLLSQESHVTETSMSPPVPPQHQTPQERVYRRPFVPGALASLPSERLLAGYVPDDEEDEEDEGIGRAMTVDHQERSDVVMSGTGSDQKSQKSIIKNGQSPAWLGRPLRPGSSSKDHTMKKVENEQDNQRIPMVKSLKSDKSEIAETATSISEPTTKDSDPNDSDYSEGDAEPEPEEEEEEEDKEKTPKPQPNRTPSSKKRKSRFEGHADDDGIYKPTDTEDSDPESEVKKSTPRKQSRRIILNHPRKLQKISPAQAKHFCTDSPPKRAPPPPPTETQSRSQSQNSNTSRSDGKHPVRTSSLKSTLKSPPPSSRLSKSKPPPLPTTRQQSASPPPSSGFAGMGADFEYKKPSLQPSIKQQINSQIKTFAEEGEDIAYAADPSEDDGVPPMPKMPRTVRLASGEIVNTQTSAAATNGNSAMNGGNAKSEGSTVSKTSGISKGSAGKLMKERKDNKCLEKQKAGSEVGAGNEKEQAMEKKSFEWPDDVF